MTHADREAFIVVDLGFGDAGKGTVTDFLARARGAHTVIRFNGGAQAGHNVVTPDGRQHVFSQFGSATFVSGVRTHLSRHMILNPLSMLEEDRHLRSLGIADAMARTTISEQALVITPFQRAANRLREMARGAGRHGSCGLGIGETVSDSIHAEALAVRAGDLCRPVVLARKLQAMQAYKRGQMSEAVLACQAMPAAKDEIAILEDGAIIGRYVALIAGFVREAAIVADDHLATILERPGTVMFEGAQGVLLDEARGFHPYTTWSVCTFDNALTLLKEAGYDGAVTRMGVTRAYATRHGAGPFVTEDAALTDLLPDAHNHLHAWQGTFRVGWTDLVALRYAAQVCGGVDALAVTCLDRLRGLTSWKVCDGYTLAPADRDDAEKYFRLDPLSGDATAIRPGQYRDLAHQQAITERIQRASPAYGDDTVHADFAHRCAAHLGRLSAALGAPVRVVSIGPSADDKYLVR